MEALGADLSKYNAALAKAEALLAVGAATEDEVKAVVDTPLLDNRSCSAIGPQGPPTSNQLSMSNCWFSCSATGQCHGGPCPQVTVIEGLLKK